MTVAPSPSGQLSESGRMSHVLLKHARDAFKDQGSVEAEWRDLNFTAPPDVAAAIDEYDWFVSLLSDDGVDVSYLPQVPGVGLDSIYVRDASVLAPRGIVLASMGKPQRKGEPDEQASSFRQRGLSVVGGIRAPGRLEGGDVVWLDPRTVLIGRGYRTNAEGIKQFESLMGEPTVECISVPLPHWRGPGDVFHLMSILSPVDRDLAVVYSPLLPVPLRETLLDRGYRFVEVPDEEFESMAANVLATGPRRCVMLDGNPRTRAGLERAGADVRVYQGVEISIKGGGGPTCLTRPLAREPL
jgi:N-dimethylarginine dimethylaminohydrolase